MKMFQRTGAFVVLVSFVFSGCRKLTTGDVSGVYESSTPGSATMLTLRTNSNYERVSYRSDGIALRFHTNLGTWSFDPTQSLVVLDENTQNCAFVFDNRSTQASLMETNLPTIPKPTITGVMNGSTVQVVRVTEVFHRRASK